MVRQIVHTAVRNTLTSSQPLGARIKLDFAKGQSTLPAPNNFRMPKIEFKATKAQPPAKNEHFGRTRGYEEPQGLYRSCAGADRLPRFVVSPLQRSPPRTPQSPPLSVVTQTSQQDVRPANPQHARHIRVERRPLPSATPMAVRLWRAVGFKPVDAKSTDAVAPKQNIGCLKNEDVHNWTPAPEDQSVQGDTEPTPPPPEPEVQMQMAPEQNVQSAPEPAPPPTEPEVSEEQLKVVADNANSPMSMRGTEELPVIRERALENVPEAKKEDDDRTITNVSPIKTDVISSDENSFVDKNGPWGSVSDERAHLDGCINKRIQCSGKLRQLYIS
ncbi:hypothetical protein AAVH_36650 [Aphelenchoides avenae]|nr:hypothetical protein AAVH_36650 [Aphelenchus avenae]